jgi:hypothetical protein
MVLKAKSRSPNVSIANAALKKRKAKLTLKRGAKALEAKMRKSGGYGQKYVSINMVPKGGIEKSPAYKKLLTRCELDSKGKPPPPEKRDGAPLKGGFPLKKYPPNVVVDNTRDFWLPDDWAQVMKNTGPGGVYHGWMSPQGKFFYHRNGYPTAMEETLGRTLTVKDGINAIQRNIRNVVKPDADQKFLQQCLTAKERKHIVPKSGFLFGVVSGRRATCESGQHDIMIIEGHFQRVGIKPTWYVDEASLKDYRKLGLNAKVGGKLVPARNMVLDDAAKQKKVAVEISDDIGKWLYYDCDKQDYRGETTFRRQNKDILGVAKHCVSPLAAAQFILAKMRSVEGDKPKLGGIFPTSNVAMTLGSEEFGRQHFILGDFFVAEPDSPCRFDVHMSLKEDYDYTCSHIKKHGSVLRCNRMFLQVKHSTNEGGAVAARDGAGAKEKYNVAVLQQKWPGVFRTNNNRKAIAGTEVVMNWNGYSNHKMKLKKMQLKVKRGKLPESSVMKVKKLSFKVLKWGTRFPNDKVVKYTKKIAPLAYINKRCSNCHNKTVAEILNMTYTHGRHGKGITKKYSYSDLAYDIKGGRLILK